MALWRSGRVEALARARVSRGLAEQERRDRVPSGYLFGSWPTPAYYGRPKGCGYSRRRDSCGAVRSAWGRPEMIICDRFRLAELQDAAGLVPLCLVSRAGRRARSTFGRFDGSPRTARWPPAPGSRDLLVASLSAALVRSDDAGSIRMVKDGSNNTGRDDVAAALTLAAGAWERSLAGPSPPAIRYHGMAG